MERTYRNFTQRFLKLSGAVLAALCVLALAPGAFAQKRMIIVDQDGSGPGGSNQMAMMALLLSPNVDVLGLTMVTGNAWRDEETAHTLRMLELIGRTDVPVVQGAVYPLVRKEDETKLDLQLYGKVVWLGAWGVQPQTDSLPGTVPATPPMHGPYVIPKMVEGEPHTKAIEEDAAHFMIRQVHTHPHQVTIYEGGPLTNVAIAIAIDPHFAELTQGIVMMGGSLNPQTDDPEFSTSPRHEFNFWFDPEAAHNVFRANWPRIDVTTVDISLKAMFTQEIIDAIAKSPNPAAQYIAKFSQERYYMWDELASCAWLDPSIITKEKIVYMDVNIDHGVNYGDTLTWTEKLKPNEDVKLVHAQLDVNLPKFTKMFEELMMRSAAAPATAAH
jgi:inosine-uridine nucleoside N-ribohydrolase